MFPAVFRNGTTPSSTMEGVINRLMNFERAFGEDGSPNPTWAGAPLAVWQDEDHVYVEVELPGVSESDLEMTIHSGMLTIQGERKAPEGRRYLYNSRNFGRFRQAIALPEDVNAEAVEAKLVDGVLSLSCPKRAETKPRKIQVKTS